MKDWRDTPLGIACLWAVAALIWLPLRWFPFGHPVNLIVDAVGIPFIVWCIMPQIRNIRFS